MHSLEIIKALNDRAAAKASQAPRDIPGMDDVEAYSILDMIHNETYPPINAVPNVIVLSRALITIARKEGFKSDNVQCILEWMSIITR